MNDSEKIKTIWLTEDNHIAIRCPTSREVNGGAITLAMNHMVMPPNGMDIDQAREQGKQQDHFLIYGFDEDDLAHLAEQIVAHLVTSGYEDKTSLYFKRKR